MDPSPRPARETTLRAFRAFASLDADLVADLARGAITKSYAHDDKVWRAGDLATRFTLIQSGLVKIVKQLPDGSVAIVGLFGPRESIGDAAVLGRQAYPAHAVVASETASVLSVDAAPVLAAMQHRAPVAQAMNQLLLEHTRALQEKITVMSAGSVPQRLATLFLLLAERFGDEMADGILRVPVHLSRRELSRLIGATEETVIRQMSRWQKTGVLTTVPDGFDLVRPETLREIVQGGGE